MLTSIFSRLGALSEINMDTLTHEMCSLLFTDFGEKNVDILCQNFGSALNAVGVNIADQWTGR